MWYNVRCFNGEEWVIFGMYYIPSEVGLSVPDSIDFDHPEKATWVGYSFWLGADALVDAE